MAAKAKRNHVELRPHFKTHVSLEIGEWFRAAEVEKITVSSLKMAEYFALGDWNDITVAFPVNIREIDRINSLAKNIQLNLLVENETALEYLSQHLRHKVGIFIKIDVGTNRTGLGPNQLSRILSLIQNIDNDSHLDFIGLLAHAGHTYGARGLRDIQQIHETYPKILTDIKTAIIHSFPSYSKLIISVGDTPSCSRMEDFGWADEIRPGNYVFYDVMQWIIGSNKLSDIAVAMACPIVAKHKDRNALIIHGGAVHFARDVMYHPFTNHKIYGLVVELSEKGWNRPDHKSYLAKLSQEHGTLIVSDELFEQYAIGDIIGVLPIHSCMTADCMGAYMDLEGHVIERM